MKNTTDNLYIMDLQLFANSIANRLSDASKKALEFFDNPDNVEAGITEENEQQPPVDTPEGATVPEGGTEVLPAEGNHPTEGQIEGQPENGPDEEILEEEDNNSIQLLHDLGLNKFNNIEDFAKSYKEMEQYAGRTKSEMRTLQEQLNAIEEKLTNQDTQFQSPANEQTSQEDGNGEVDPLLDNDALVDMLYSDPARVFQQIKEQAKAEALAEIQPTLEPLAQERQQNQAREEWMNRVDQFGMQYPDVSDWAEDMSKVLMENPELRNQPNGLEIAYNTAKGRAYQPPQDPTSYLQDETFVNENVLNNEQIREAVIKDYLEKINQGGSPIQIGQGNAQGDSTAIPPKRPASLDEANEMATRLFEQNNR